MDFIFRNLDLNDIDNFVNMYIKFLEELFPLKYKDPPTDYRSCFANQLYNMFQMNYSKYIGVFYNGSLVAICSTFDEDDNQRTLFADLYIDPNFRGKGILEVLIKEAKNRSRYPLYLIADPFNFKVINKYIKLGWKIVSINDVDPEKYRANLEYVLMES